MSTETFIREFVAGVDPITGGLGWKSVTVHMFEPRDYRHLFGVAHDTMEHPENIDATLKNELQAQGAALYVRPSAELPSLVASNIAWFYKQVHAGKFPGAPARSEIFSDLKWGGYAIWNVIQQIQLVEPLTEFEQATIACWMAQGYKDAQVRYANVTNSQLTTMFNDICAAVTNIGTSAQIGDKLTVVVGRGFARVEHSC